MSVERAESIPCVRLVELVTDYLEGGLTTAERAIFESHLLSCEGCVSYVEQMRKTIELTGRLRANEMPRELEDALTRAFRGWHSNSPG